MSFKIKFDYSFDQSGFFTPERKVILEKAGDLWSSYIQDDFTAIPAEEILRVPINNVEQEVILNEPIDDLIIYASAKEFDSNQSTLAKGAFSASFTTGSDRENRIKGDDFEPWLGTIEFNANIVDNFYFDSTLETDDDIPSDRSDFFSVSLHEIGHILGIGIAPAFTAQIQEGNFTGTQSVALNDGQPIPLTDEQDHIQDGFSLDPDTDVLLDESLTSGERDLPTSLELAILSDIGYEISALDRTEVHRFYRSDRGFHFYTADDNEQQVIRDLSAAGELPYTYEGVAYDVLASDTDSLTGAKVENTLPVYRFFNRATGAHLYTMDENEKNFIQENLAIYDFEDVAYYAFESQPEAIETIPLYRMFNTQSGSHLFTSDTNEFNVLQETQSQFQIEGNEGITFYVLP